MTVATKREVAADATTIPAVEAGTVSSDKAKYVFGALRITVGLIFLWAFADKLFGLGFATPAESAWINGGSPTFGFLSFGTAGPLAGFYGAIAGAAWADWLFMIGLGGIGVAMTLGIGLRIAAVTGTLLVLMMWSASLPPENNPVITYHFVYALAFIGFALADAGKWVGLGGKWQETALVRRFPVLA
jgi:thiosulfate dehydrogenase (quinone) large subunit